MSAGENVAAARRIVGLGVLLVGGLAAARLTALAGSAQLAAYETAFTAIASLSWVIMLRRVLRTRPERAVWLPLAACLATGMTSDCLVGWSSVAHSGVVRAVGQPLGMLAYPLALMSLTTLLRLRLRRLPFAAWLDGMSGALVLQAAIALLFLHPLDLALERHAGGAGLDLVYPLADVSLVALVAAGAARGGWRLEGWGLLLGGSIAIALGDSIQSAAASAGGYHPGGPADFAWLAGAWMLAAAAWRPAPARGEPAPSGPLISSAFALAALALLVTEAVGAIHSQLVVALAAACLTTIVVRFAVALRENKHVLLTARLEAVTDALTGLPNRRRLVADLERLQARSKAAKPASLVLLDLNGFKGYNDTFGHQAGDLLLTSLAGRLAEAVRGRGVAYRMGGDEFCVLFAPATGDPEADATLAAQALSADGDGFAISAAHGTVLVPAEAETASEALRLADQRMYSDKASGRTGSGQQVSDALQRTLLERDPRRRAELAIVRPLAGRVAVALGLAETEVERVELAAVLHDIGMVAVPDRILDKPGRLDAEEWALVRSHTTIGQRIIEAAPALRDVATIVRATHERIDGHGYPDGLRGDSIPVAARIVSVCDAYAAMTSGRPYRPPLSLDAALAELRAGAGTQFDERVVAVFEAALAGEGVTAQATSWGVPEPAGAEANDGGAMSR